VLRVNVLITSLRPHSGGPGSVPDKFMWDFRWTEWQWDTFCWYCGFPLSVSFHLCYTGCM